jgi:hypothetical protein
VEIQTRGIASIIVLPGLICLVMVLRRAGLVTLAPRPSLIFASPAKSVLHWEYVPPA